MAGGVEAGAVVLGGPVAPSRPDGVPGMELATRHRAGDGEQCGDLIDVFRAGANDWAVLVGDVCGHGARAATLTSLALTAVRASAPTTFLPSTVLAALNARLVDRVGVQVGGSDDRWLSAALARVELDECGAWVTVASAGHPRPVVVRRAGWLDVRGHVGTPLGMFPAAELTDDRVGLGPGDSLVLVTDGITEVRDASGELFGEEALPELLLDACGEDAESLASRILDGAEAFAGGGRARDDLAVVVLRVPPESEVSPPARLAAATEAAGGALPLPGYPVGEAYVEAWRGRPLPPREARTRLPADPASLAGLRELLRRLLRSWRMEEVAGGDLELLATELAANAIAHAGTGATVLVRWLGPVIRLEVGDGSREVAAPRVAEPHDLGGRGLAIVEALSSAWGTVPTRDGKRVWCDLPVPLA